MAASLRAVAELAQVDATTVRFVLSGKTKNSGCADRVRAAANQLGYVYRPQRLLGRPPPALENPQ